MMMLKNILKKILKQNLVKTDLEFAYCYHGLAKINEKQGNLTLSIENLIKH